MKKSVLLFLFICIITILSSCSCVKKYEVIFDSKGGSSIETQIVRKNKTVNKPEDPTREGYTFLYWTLDSMKYDFFEKVTSNITLVARWEENINYTEGLTFSYTKDGYIVSGIGVADYESDIIIPSEYNNVKVIGIGEYAFTNCSNIVSITIPDSVVYIMNNAFENCSGLKTINLPNTISKIEAYTFANCQSLKIFNIPSSITYISEYAFENCSSLEKVVIPSSVTTIEASTFYNCNILSIYCEVYSMPKTWSLSWNIHNCPVVWGYSE